MTLSNTTVQTRTQAARAQNVMETVGLKGTQHSDIIKDMLNTRDHTKQSDYASCHVY